MARIECNNTTRKIWVRFSPDELLVMPQYARVRINEMGMVEFTRAEKGQGYNGVRKVIKSMCVSANQRIIFGDDLVIQRNGDVYLLNKRQ
jgi:hypothetical protein